MTKPAAKVEKKPSPAVVDEDRMNRLRNEVHDIQVAGAPASPAVVGTNAHGSAVVRFNPQFSASCETREDAEALARHINDLIREPITRQHVRLLDELRTLASTAYDALKKGHP